MPVDIRVIHARDFIKATPQGELDREESLAVLRAVAAAAAPPADFAILLDTRQATSQLSVADLWYLASEFARFPLAFRHKTAVLCPVERFDQADFFALCAANRGFRVQAFTAYEGAMEWLLS